MDNDNILCQNIEILVYGPTKDKFIEFANINSSSSVVYEKKHTSKSSSSKSEHYNTAIKTEELAKLHSNYCSKINKLHDLHDDIKTHNTHKSEKTPVSALRKDPEQHFFAWGDLKKSTVTVSTLNFWINANFCQVSDMFLDPYINNVIAGNVNLLVITFNSNDKDSFRRALSLYSKLETEKPPSSIKYQSQKLLLQQGYYHSYNENIVLALCENPHLEPMGKCLLVGFGNKAHQISSENIVREMKIKTSPKVIMIDDSDFGECETRIGETYDWIFEAHHKMKNSLSLDDSEKKELREAIKKSFVTKHTDQKKECSMF